MEVIDGRIVLSEAEQKDADDAAALEDAILAVVAGIEPSRACGAMQNAIARTIATQCPRDNVHNVVEFMRNSLPVSVAIFLMDDPQEAARIANASRNLQ